MSRRSEPDETGPSQKILTAAYRCISARGYANVSLRDIADEAGVVLSQLNYYYRNKEGLFIEVLRILSRNYMKEIRMGMKNGTTAKEKISCLLSYFQDMLQNRPEIFKLLFDMTSMSLWKASFNDQLRDMFSDLSSVIETEISNVPPSEANVDGYSPKVLARRVVSALFGTAMQAVLDPDEKNVRASLSALQISFE